MLLLKAISLRSSRHEVLLSSIHTYLQARICSGNNPYVNFLDFNCAAGISRYKSWLFWEGSFVFKGVRRNRKHRKMLCMLSIFSSFEIFYFLKHTWHYGTENVESRNGQKGRADICFASTKFVKVPAQRSLRNLYLSTKHNAFIVPYFIGGVCARSCLRLISFLSHP